MGCCCSLSCSKTDSAHPDPEQVIVGQEPKCSTALKDKDILHLLQQFSIEAPEMFVNSDGPIAGAISVQSQQQGGKCFDGPLAAPTIQGAESHGQLKVNVQVEGWLFQQRVNLEELLLLPTRSFTSLADPFEAGAVSGSAQAYAQWLVFQAPSSLRGQELQMAK